MVKVPGKRVSCEIFHKCCHNFNYIALYFIYSKFFKALLNHDRMSLVKSDEFRYFGI